MTGWRCRLLGLLIFLAGLLASAAGLTALAAPPVATLATPAAPVASPAQLAQAQMEWAASAHAETYDNGLGANLTCARCKSPLNWDPLAPAAEAALNCSACKRTPGAARPDLEGGVPVPESEWLNIGCAVCHPPSGDSYLTSIAYWDQVSGAYQPVASAAELCAKCHEGRHGFEVMAEQAASPAHADWECTVCHGAHGLPVTCTDCHNPATGSGALEHSRHTLVNCTACHDAGGLRIWQESASESRHYQEYVPIRFAHTLTSWPSHNLQAAVDCRRCHHPVGELYPAVAAGISCDDCHPGGAALYWCTGFPRDDAPAPAPGAALDP